MFEMEKCIQVAYLEYRDQQQSHIQAQFIRIKTEVIDILLICSKHENVVEHNYNQQYYKKNHKIIVNGKGKFVLKSLVQHHMIS